MTGINGGYSTVCLLCRKEIARAPLPLNIPLEGEPDFQALQYLGMLDKHLKKRHPEQARNLASSTMEFGAMLLIACYKVDDTSVSTRADLIRDTFISQFARQVSDADLDGVIDRVMANNQQTDPPNEGCLYRDQAQEIVRALRDLFTCRGKYAPQTTALKEAPLVLVP